MPSITFTPSFLRSRVNYLLGVAALAVCSFAFPAVADSLPFSPVTGNSPDYVETVADLTLVNETLKWKGSLLGTGDGDALTELVITLGNLPGTTPVDIASDDFGVSYRDEHQREARLQGWQWRFIGQHNGDTVLDDGEVVQLTLPLSTQLAHPLRADTDFVVEIHPAQGAILSMVHTTPSEITPMMTLR